MVLIAMFYFYDQVEIRRTIFVSTVLSLAVFVFIYYSETSSFDKVTDYWIGLIVASILGLLVGFSILFTRRFLNKKIPWYKNIAIRMASEILAGLILMMLGALLFVHVYLKTLLIDIDLPFNQFIYDGAIKFAILAIVIITIYALVSFYLFSYKWYNKGRIEVLTSDKDQRVLRLEVLKSQLSPHFLFNSLNTISSLAADDCFMAEKYTRQLTSTFRYILNVRNKNLVCLKDELKMVGDYINMFRIKYGHSIQTEIEGSAKNCKSMIVPLTLQILVENAIKHNSFSESNPLNINIKVAKNRICISNNIITGKVDECHNQVNEKSYKIGLVNIVSRYSFLTDKKVEIEKNGDFIVKIPLIRNEE